MRVRDYMTKNVVTVEPDVRLTEVVSIMESNDFHRVPVVDANNVYQGLITEAIIANNSPSSASSLSIYEMNYLLDKQTAGQLMTEEAQTIGKDITIEAAAAQMYDYGLSVLIVVDEQNKVIGIITDKDIFAALIELTGYRQAGARFELKVEDKMGVLHEVSGILSGLGVDISHLYITDRDGTNSILVVQTDNEESQEVLQVLKSKGYDAHII